MLQYLIYLSTIASLINFLVLAEISKNDQIWNLNQTHAKIRLTGGWIHGLVSQEDVGTGNLALFFKFYKCGGFLTLIDDGILNDLVPCTFIIDKDCKILGIPMAEPPVGKLRFRQLRKKRPWTVLDATKYSPSCLSNSTRTTSPQHYISEDCIYMNVFTNSKCLSDHPPCPILFLIHGGGFAFGSATMFNDTQIVHKYVSANIVFMIPAYRLGVFGFLDLGNDGTVKRNLGMHDIIFALKWAKYEANAFGGDPSRITVMGYSSGGSAIAYLFTSPAVDKDLFQQAIISSAVPFFTNNYNLLPSNALLRRLNCTHSNRTGLRYSNREKADCLRRIDALELLRQQQSVEEHEKLLFDGPQSDSTLLPARNFAALFKFWKARPMLWTVMAQEFDLFPQAMSNNQSILLRLIKECHNGLLPLGYFSEAAFDTCMNRYSPWLYSQQENMHVSYESMNALAFLSALVNKRNGGQSYLGEFELANHSVHAHDMVFFVGLHAIATNRTDARLMDMYYPRMIRNFVHGNAPDPNWKPQSWDGRNYFRITFNVSQNGTLLERPNNVSGYQDYAGLRFWLHELAEVERNAIRKSKESGEPEQTWQYIFEPEFDRDSMKRNINKIQNFFAIPNRVKLQENNESAADESAMGVLLHNVWLALSITMLLSIVIFILYKCYNNSEKRQNDLSEKAHLLRYQ